MTIIPSIFLEMFQEKIKGSSTEVCKFTIKRRSNASAAGRDDKTGGQRRQFADFSNRNPRGRAREDLCKTLRLVARLRG